MRALVKAEETSKLMMSLCLMIGFFFFNSNVQSDVSDGVAANGLGEALCTLLARPVVDDPFNLDDFLLELFRANPKSSLLCSDDSSAEMASLTAVSLYWLMSPSYCWRMMLSKMRSLIALDS